MFLYNLFKLSLAPAYISTIFSLHHLYEIFNNYKHVNDSKYIKKHIADLRKLYTSKTELDVDNEQLKKTVFAVFDQQNIPRPKGIIVTDKQTGIMAPAGELGYSVLLLGKDIADLISTLTDDNHSILAAIISHEIAHVKYRHEMISRLLRTFVIYPIISYLSFQTINYSSLYYGLGLFLIYAINVIRATINVVSTVLNKPAIDIQELNITTIADNITLQAVRDFINIINYLTARGLRQELQADLYAAQQTCATHMIQALKFKNNFEAKQEYPYTPLSHPSNNQRIEYINSNSRSVHSFGHSA